MNTVFTSPPRPPDDQRALVTETYRANKAIFATRALARNFLSFAFAPQDLSWVFKSNAKAAGTSALAYLFELEFGVPLNVGLQTQAEPNTDSAVHRLREAHIFRSLLEHRACNDPAATLANTFSFTTVRHPATRAASAFRYICKANATRSDKFLNDRLRLSAITGFDWDRHPYTTDGFIRFLDFIKTETPNSTVAPLNTHWRPQVLNVQPAFLKPDLIGKVEDLPGFFAALSDRLGKPLLTTPHRNQQPADSAELLAGKTAMALITEIYADDFESFGYDA